MGKVLAILVVLSALLAVPMVSTVTAEQGPMPTCNPNGNGHCK